MSSSDMALIQYEQCPQKKREMLAGYAHREKATWGHSKKAVISKPQRETSGKTNHIGTLILVFQLPELWGNKIQLFMPPNLWYFCYGSLCRLTQMII